VLYCTHAQVLLPCVNMLVPEKRALENHLHWEQLSSTTVALPHLLWELQSHTWQWMTSKVLQFSVVLLRGSTNVQQKVSSNVCVCLLPDHTGVM